MLVIEPTASVRAIFPAPMPSNLNDFQRTSTFKYESYVDIGVLLLTHGLSEDTFKLQQGEWPG